MVTVHLTYFAVSITTLCISQPTPPLCVHFSNRKPGASIPPPAVSMVSSRAMVSAPSPAMYRSLATASRKSAQHFQSFRKFGSLFRLNNSATNTKVVPPQTPKPANQTSGQEEDDVDAMANFYQHGEQGGSGGETAAVGVVGERQRTYSAALPSAAYLGISIDGNTGGAGAQGTLTTNGNAVVQPSESITTTTSTGVSTDAYSLTTSSNFFSTAESSVESLGVSNALMTCFLLVGRWWWCDDPQSNPGRLPCRLTF